MVESTTYKDSVKRKELVPQIMLAGFENEEDEWSIWEVAEILHRYYEQFHGDMEHNAVRYIL